MAEALPVQRGGVASVVLVVALIAAFVAAIGAGAVRLRPDEILSALVAGLGVGEVDQRAGILLSIRLPRVLLGCVVGATLATCGTLLQGLFRNSLADPGLIGVSSGASLAAAAAIVLLPGLAGGTAILALPLLAFLGALAATALVLAIGAKGGVATLLLAGIAINALGFAGTGLLTSVATDVQLRSLTFWNLGSLGGATWTALLAVLVPAALVQIVARRRSRELDAWLLGSREAALLGVHVQAMRRTVVVVTALGVGSCVAITGSVGFVGLVVPNLLRLVVGPAHRSLVPASALLGAVALVCGDLLARTAVAPVELPIGVVTAFVGTPFFLFLLVRSKGMP